jgi:hypothetical protein
MMGREILIIPKKPIIFEFSLDCENGKNTLGEQRGDPYPFGGEIPNTGKRR